MVAPIANHDATAMHIVPVGSDSFVTSREPAELISSPKSHRSAKVAPEVPHVSAELQLDTVTLPADSARVVEEPALLFWQKRGFIRWRRRLFFVLGVINLIVTAFAIFHTHWILPYLHTAVVPFLVFLRLFVYSQHKWHLFLIDFCYFGNTLVMLYLWAFPGNAYLFTVCFAVSCGPLFWAVCLFRNSLVFHDVDKMTSIYIHVSPPLVLYTIRWYPQELSSHWYTPFGYCIQPSTNADDCQLPYTGNSFLYAAFIPVAAFIAHSLLYFFFVHVVLGRKLKEDKRYLYSYRYLLENREGLLFRAVNIFGKRGRIPMYGILNWLYCFVGLVPVIVWFNYHTANVVFFIVILTVATFNGATFYLRFIEDDEHGAERKAKKKTAANEGDAVGAKA